MIYRKVRTRVAGKSLIWNGGDLAEPFSHSHADNREEWSWKEHDMYATLCSKSDHRDGIEAGTALRFFWRSWHVLTLFAVDRINFGSTLGQVLGFHFWAAKVMWARTQRKSASMSTLPTRDSLRFFSKKSESYPEKDFLTTMRRSIFQLRGRERCRFWPMGSGFEFSKSPQNIHLSGRLHGSSHSFFNAGRVGRCYNVWFINLGRPPKPSLFR